MLKILEYRCTRWTQQKLLQEFKDINNKNNLPSINFFRVLSMGDTELVGDISSVVGEGWITVVAFFKVLLSLNNEVCRKLLLVRITLS